MCNIAKKRLACLASGSGSNMQAIIDDVKSGNINGEVVLVIASNGGAYALERAKKAGIESHVCALRNYPSAKMRDDEILRLLKKHNIDYVILAGYLGVVSDSITKAFKNRIINIHPALLPKFGGKGFFGLNVHKAVIESGEKVSGATVHFVDCGVDTGLIIAQKQLNIYTIDTPETLQKRILEEVEHDLLVSVVRKLCLDKVKVENGTVVVLD